MVERFEPGPGEGRRGVRYWDWVGERREEGALLSLGVGIVVVRGLEGDIGASAMSSGPRVDRRGRALPDEPLPDEPCLECRLGVESSAGFSMA